MSGGKVYKRCGCSVPVLDGDGEPVRDRKGRPKRQQAGQSCSNLRRGDGSWNPRHGTWTISVSVRGRDGKRRQVVRSGYDSASDARAALDRLRERDREGVTVSDRQTVGEYLTSWIESKAAELRPATLRSYRGHIERILVPELGHLRLDALRVEHAQPVLAAVPGSDATRQRVRATLRSALADAQRERLVTVNVATLVKLPRGKAPRPIVWTDERVARWRKSGERPSPVMVWTPAQVGAFLDATANDRLAALWALLAYCGLRRGEAAALRWDDLDLDNGRLTVSSQLTVVDWHVIEGDPKSEAGHRTFPLDQVTIGPLRAHRKAQAADRLRWGAAWQGSTNRVFTTEDGADIHPATISERFGELVKAAGLPPVRLHDLRHSAASAMLAAGVDMKTVQETLGHSAMAVTADTYSSVVPELSAAAAAATAAVIPRKTGAS